jgi:hypothetical protein
MRFSQVGERGIFAALEQGGYLDHRVPEVGNIEYATKNPPTAGRARLRGQWVRRSAGRRATVLCDWAGICDPGNERFLDLSHPFETRERWRALNKSGKARPGSEPEIPTR